MGTPGYLAPEQVRGESAGPAADVFAWGAIGYELLAGVPAFGSPGLDAATLLYNVVNVDPVPFVCAAILINGVALGTFVATGAIAWVPGLVMVAGGVTGGYVGASVARRVPGGAVGGLVVVVAWGMTGYFFLR